MFARRNLVWLAIYVFSIMGVSWGLYYARQQTLTTLDTAQAQGDWQQWRAEAGRPTGPVERRVPKSEEPPGLVLLRDHFATSWLILVVLTSLVFATLVWMIRGVIAGPKFEPSMSDSASDVPIR